MAAASTFLKSINLHKVSCNKTGGNKGHRVGLTYVLIGQSPVPLACIGTVTGRFMPLRPAFDSASPALRPRRAAPPDVRRHVANVCTKRTCPRDQPASGRSAAPSG